MGSSTGHLDDCSYALGEVGRGLATGGRAYVTDTIPSVMAHELGHNFGLGHSSARQCDSAVDTGTCRTAPYRDLYDVMGVSWAQLGSLNAPQAARLGVLPAAAQAGLSVRGTATSVHLAALSGRTGTRALRLTDASGVVYWLEYRSATAQDGWLEKAAQSRPFGRLEVTAPADPLDPDVRFDAILNAPPGLVADGPMARLREPSYAAARNA